MLWFKAIMPISFTTHTFIWHDVKNDQHQYTAWRLHIGSLHCPIWVQWSCYLCACHCSHYKVLVLHLHAVRVHQTKRGVELIITWSVLIKELWGLSSQGGSSRVIRQMEHCRSCSGGSRFSPGRAGRWRAAQTRHTAGGGPAPWSRHQREAARAVDRLRGVEYRYGIAMWPLAVLQV